MEVVMIKLISAFKEDNEKLETTAATSPISDRQMIVTECNGIPVYVDLKDRVCLPIEETKKVL